MFTMPTFRWTGLVDKISVLLTIKIVVHLMTFSLTPAQTTGKYWSSNTCYVYTAAKTEALCLHT